MLCAPPPSGSVAMTLWMVHGLTVNPGAKSAKFPV
jgi:hypothetical protein